MGTHYSQNHSITPRLVPYPSNMPRLDLTGVVGDRPSISTESSYTSTPHRGKPIKCVLPYTSYLMDMDTLSVRAHPHHIYNKQSTPTIGRTTKLVLLNC